MTSKQLATKIQKLSPQSVIALSLQSSKKVWYKTQKEHWLGWISEYDGPGAYGRTKWGDKDACYVYNHVQCAPMLLWLAEALFIPRPILIKAKRAVINSGKSGASQCSALRKVIPWEMVYAKLIIKK